MNPIADDFRAGAPISQVPVSWFKSVAKFINSLVPGRGIFWPKSDGDINAIEVDGDAVYGMIEGKVEGKIDEKMTTTAPAAAPLMVSGSDATHGTATTFIAGAPGGTGATIYILCRTHSAGQAASLEFRPFTITSDGRIYAIAAEDGTGVDVILADD